MKYPATRRYWMAPGLALAALLTWGSWQAPPLHLYAPAGTFALLAAPGLPAGPAAERLRTQALALPGVSACAVRPDRGVLVVAYDPTRLGEAELSERLGGLRPLPVPPPVANARQCPVPSGYVLALERLRFSLNLRRLFFHV